VNIIDDYTHSGSGRNIAALESLRNKNDWLTVRRLTVSAFEMEDHVLPVDAQGTGGTTQGEQPQCAARSQSAGKIEI
jgi:hypothetical protein